MLAKDDVMVLVLDDADSRYSPCQRRFSTNLSVFIAFESEIKPQVCSCNIYRFLVLHFGYESLASCIYCIKIEPYSGNITSLYNLPKYSKYALSNINKPLD